MKATRSSRFLTRATIGVAAIGALCAGRLPAEGFTFVLDPLVLEVLETDVDTSSSKFEEYGDLGSGFDIPSLHVEGEDENGRYLEFIGTHLSRQDARYTLLYGVSGDYRFTLDYNKIPHRFGNDGTFLWEETAPGRLEIPDTTQAGLQAALEARRAAGGPINFAFLNDLLRPFLAATDPIDVALRRDRTHARVELGRLGTLGWTIDFSHENRSGSRPWGGSFGFGNVTEIPEPIDYDTTHADVAGEWNGESGGVRFGVRYSRFENNVSTLVWDNPFRITDATDPNAYTAPASGSIGGARRAFADLAPDNDSASAYCSARARFGSWWSNGTLTWTRMEQDDPLLPYTLNSAIVGIDPFTHSTFDPTNVANLPADSADAKVEVLNLDGALGTRLGDAWSLTFRLRYYDYDNESPRIEFPGYVRFHAVWEEIPRITVPYAYTRSSASAELDWELTKSEKLGFSYERKRWDRDFRETNQTDEDILKLTFDSRRFDGWTLHGRLEHGDRSFDRYLTEAQLLSFVETEAVNNLPGLRKYPQAAREYDNAWAQAQWSASDALQLVFGVTWLDQDYDESEFGLIGDESLQYDAELGFTPGENLTFYVFGSRSDRSTQQASRQSGATPSTNPNDNWSIDFDEANDTWGLGLTAALGDASKLDLQGRWSNSDGEADFFRPPGATVAPVDIDNYEDVELLSLVARYDHELGEHVSCYVYYRYDDYTIDRFINEGILPYLPGALLLAANDGDYQLDLFAVGMKLAF